MQHLIRLTGFMEACRAHNFVRVPIWIARMKSMIPCNTILMFPRRIQIPTDVGGVKLRRCLVHLKLHNDNRHDVLLFNFSYWRHRAKQERTHQKKNEWFQRRHRSVRWSIWSISGIIHFLREADRPEFLIDGRRAAKQTFGLPPPTLRAERAAMAWSACIFWYLELYLWIIEWKKAGRRGIYASSSATARLWNPVEVQTDITCLLNVFRTAQAASITNHKTAPMLFWGSCALEHSCCSLWFMSDNMRWDGRKSGLEWTRKSWSSVVFFGFLKIVGLWSVWLK